MSQTGISEQQAVELLAYLLSAAELTLVEPDLYGVFRLLDAAGRLSACVIENNPAAPAIFHEIQREIEQKKGWLMWDREGFRAFAAEMPRLIAAEIDRSYARSSSEASHG